MDYYPKDINEGPNTDVNTKKVITADWAKSE